MFHIYSPIVLFSYGKVKDIFVGIRITFHLGKVKARGKKGVWGERTKMMVIFARFLLISKIQTLSHKFLVRQTYNHHIAVGMPKNPFAGIFK